MSTLLFSTSGIFHFVWHTFYIIWNFMCRTYRLHPSVNNNKGGCSHIRLCNHRLLFNDLTFRSQAVNHIFSLGIRLVSIFPLLWAAIVLPARWLKQNWMNLIICSKYHDFCVTVLLPRLFLRYFWMVFTSSIWTICVNVTNISTHLLHSDRERSLFCPTRINK